MLADCLRASPAHSIQHSGKEQLQQKQSKLLSGHYATGREVSTGRLSRQQLQKDTSSKCNGTKLTWKTPTYNGSYTHSRYGDTNSRSTGPILSKMLERRTDKNNITSSQDRPKGSKSVHMKDKLQQSILYVNQQKPFCQSRN